MEINKDIDIFQAHHLAMMIQVKEGTLTIDQAIAIHRAAMDKSVIDRVLEELAASKKM